MKAVHDRRALLIAPMILVSVVLGCLTLTDGHNWGDDFALYIRQAQSLAMGTAAHFADTNRFTTEHCPIPQGPLAYPWGLPLLLTPIYLLFGLNLTALKGLTVVCYACALGCLGVLFAPRLRGSMLVPFVGLFAFSPTMLHALDNILSDVPFLFFALASIALIDRTIVRRGPARPRRATLAVLGAVTAGAALIRTNGILLFPVLAVCQLVEAVRREGGSEPRRDWRTLLDALVPYGAAALVFVAVSWLPDGGLSHTAQFKPSRAVVLASGRYYLPLLGQFFGCSESIAVGVVLVVLSLIGLVRVGRRDYHFTLFLALTFGLYLAWPAGQGLRFLYPILPFFFYFVCVGLAELCARFGARTGRLAPSAVVGAAAVALLALSIAGAYRNLAAHRQIEGPFDPSCTEVFHYLVANTRSDAVVVFFKPRVAQLCTGRICFTTPRPADLLLADYIVLQKGRSDGGQTAEIPRNDPKRRFEAIFENDRYTVFEKQPTAQNP